MTINYRMLRLYLQWKQHNKDIAIVIKQQYAWNINKTGGGYGESWFGYSLK